MASCEIVQIFTYWLDGKVTSFPNEMHKEPAADTTHFKFVDIHRTPLTGNVDAAFLEATVIGQWHLRKENEVTSSSHAYNDCLKRFIYNPSSQLKSGPHGLRLSEVSYKGRPCEAVSVKLFWTGVLCIVIRRQIPSPSNSEKFNEQELDVVADLIKRPERTSLFIERTESQKPPDKETRGHATGQHIKELEMAEEIGDLNVLSARCARYVAKLFADDIKALAEEFKRPKKAWFADPNVKRADPTLSVTDLFRDWRPEYINPYTVSAMDNLPLEVRKLVNLRDSDTEGAGKDVATAFCSQLATLSTTNPSGTRNSFVKPVQYVLQNNVARGNVIVMVDRRCTVAAGLSYKEPGTMPLIETLTFSLECILAASESTKRFIAALDQREPQQNYAFNAHLATTYIGDNIIVPIKQRTVLELLGRTVENLLKILSAARALSPCDEKINQVESYVMSKTVIVAVTEMKKMQLNNLIELAHNKMTATTRLYETSYDFVSHKNAGAISERVAILTKWLYALTVALTVLTALVIGATLYYGEVHKTTGERIHGSLKDITERISPSP